MITRLPAIAALLCLSTVSLSTAGCAATTAGTASPAASGPPATAESLPALLLPAADVAAALAGSELVVTKEATARKVQIQINLDVDPETVTTFLRKIDPMLCYQLALAKKVKLIETLKEVKMQEPDTSFLAKEYLEILENEDAIKRQLREQPGRLQFLYSIVTDLYVDHHKFKGQNVTAQVPQLQRVLQDYSIEAVLGFFARG
jgi:hypothetical protein